MSIRSKLAARLACLAFGAVLPLAACSSDPPRDINYGKDAGANYTPPDGKIIISPDSPTGTTSGSEAGTEKESGSPADAAPLADTPPVEAPAPDANLSSDISLSADQDASTGTDSSVDEGS